MSVKQKVQDNPMMATVTSIGALAVAVVAIYNGMGLIDRIILTESEAAEIHMAFHAQHDTFAKKIDEQSLLNECRWLSDKIDTLEYEIYVLERDDAPDDFLRSKRTVLNKSKAKYDFLQCVTML